MMPLRRVLIAGLTVAAVSSVLWWALWSIAAMQYRGVIDGWIEKGRAAGYDIAYDKESLFGFPRHVVMRFTNVHWKNTDGIIFHAAFIDIAAEPWRWRAFDASFKSDVAIDAPLEDGQQSLSLAASEGRAHVELDQDGGWTFVRLVLANAKLGRAPDYLFLADGLKASATRPAEPPRSNKEPGLILAGEAHNVTPPASMPTPFGPKMAAIDLGMRVMGIVPDVRRKAAVEAWNRDSGVVEFDQLDMDWGPLKLKARGTMGFDDDLQPEGAFSGAVGGHEAVLKALMAGGFIAPRQEGMLNSALSLFARPAPGANTPGIELPITVQLGGLFLGPVRIFTFPEIVWPQDVAK